MERAGSWEILSSARVCRGWFWLATQTPGQVAGHDVSDHGEEHQENRDPENPTMMYSLPTGTMRMIFVRLVHAKRQVTGELEAGKVQSTNLSISNAGAKSSDREIKESPKSGVGVRSEEELIRKARKSGPRRAENK
jgi:hypothetical protein